MRTDRIPHKIPKLKKNLKYKRIMVNSIGNRDELEFLERVFLLASVIIETDSITIKMPRSFFVNRNSLSYHWTSKNQLDPGNQKRSKKKTSSI